MALSRAIAASDVLPLIGGAAPPNGVSAPVLIRGSADLSTYPGVVTGVLPDTAARTANGVLLQVGLDWCAANGKYAEMPPARYEYIAQATQNGLNTGLHCKKGVQGLIGAGTALTRIVQFATNHPVLTIGDMGTNNNDLTSGATFGGFGWGHGVSQAGQTQGVGLLLGRLCYCDFTRPMESNPFLVGTFPPYNGVQIGKDLSTFFFSNRFGTLNVFQAQQSYIESKSGGTGNRWENLYFGSGTFGNRVSLSGPPVNFAAGGVDYGSIGQLNIEWSNSSSAGAGAMMVNGDGLIIDHLHLEGVQCNGFSVPLIQVVVGKLTIGSMKALDLWIAAANASGTPKIFGSYGDSQINVGRAYLAWSGAGVSPEAVASMPFQFYNDGYSPVGYKATVQADHIAVLNNTGAFGLDTTLPGAAPGAAGAITSVGGYRYNKSRSRTEDASVAMANANMTFYGQHRSARITMAATLTANRNLILSDKVAASGAGATSVRGAGDIVNVLRTGAGAFDLVVYAQDGTTVLHTFSGAAAANTEKSFEWSGSAWTAL